MTMHQIWDAGGEQFLIGAGVPMLVAGALLLIGKYRQ